MKQGYRGIGKVFRFTFARQTESKGYRVATVILAVLFLALPAAIMVLAELFGGTDSGEGQTRAVQSVYLADLSGEEPVSAALLELAGTDGFAQTVYHDCGNDLDSAIEQAGKEKASLIVVTDKNEESYSFSVLIPEGSELETGDASALEGVLRTAFSLTQAQKSGLSGEELAGLLAQGDSLTGQEDEGGEGQEDAALEEEGETSDSVFRDILSMILPLINVMLLYFLVLFYGQGVARNVLSEKTSKLMDTFLVSVKPEALILGKVFAVVLASALQFAIWLAALACGFAAGYFLVLQINPDSTMAAITFIRTLGMFSGAFSLPGVFVGTLIVVAGFLLYCSLAAIGGAAAGKPEDLNSTNVLFTLALVVSFLCSLYAGGLSQIDSGTAGPSAAWLDWIPFTAVLLTPSRVMLGDLSLLGGVGSLAVVVIVSVLLLMLAGKVYRMMSFYKGNPPTPAKLFQMLRQK